MLKYVLLLLLAFLFNTAEAQIAKSDSENSIFIFENHIIDYYKPDSTQIKALCENSCIFIRFKLLKDGKIANLAFTKDVPFSGDTAYSHHIPAIIIYALKSAFKKIELDLNVPRDLQSDEKTYVLPFIYYYNSGCYIMRKEEDKKIAMLNSSGKIVEEEQFERFVGDILSFDDKKFDKLECTILAPIQVGKK